MAEWRNGGIAEWRNGGMDACLQPGPGEKAEWRNSGMAEWTVY